jgi:hypothetical protein
MTLEIFKSNKDFEKKYISKFVKVDGDLLQSWEKSVLDYENTAFGVNYVSNLLPFARAVKPLISMEQDNNSGLSLIAIKRSEEADKNEIKYALSPLIEEKIINKKEANKISGWFKKNPEDNRREIRKNFTINGYSYVIIAEIYKKHRYLNLYAIGNSSKQILAS